MKFFHRAKPVVPSRGIHLDLKGLPPSPKRLLEILDLLAELRINAVLVEWEDMFPWKTYPELRSPVAYSERTVRRFFRQADALSIEVIPLVQSFGHMENVLSKRRFRRFREHPLTPFDLCPTKPGSRRLVFDLVKDVIELGGGRITRFHLGGDEAFFLGTCARCRAFIRKHGRDQLYLHHVLPLLEDVSRLGPRPILWDDMMRRWPVASLRRIQGQADLMFWQYGDTPFAPPGPTILDRYARAGIRLWGASAFKGAHGVHTDFPDLSRRATNLVAWGKEARRREFQGIVATGWSRFATFLVPCEGLESSLDALVLAAASMWDGTLPKDYAEQAQRFLNRPRLKRLGGEPFERCLAASRALTAWRDELLTKTQAHFDVAELVGEPERVDELRQRRIYQEYRDYLAAGEKLGRAWIRAHRGLVSPFWLQRYAESRLIPARKVIGAVIAGLPHYCSLNPEKKVGGPS